MCEVVEFGPNPILPFVPQFVPSPLFCFHNFKQSLHQKQQNAFFLLRSSAMATNTHLDSRDSQIYKGYLTFSPFSMTFFFYKVTVFFQMIWGVCLFLKKPFFWKRLRVFFFRWELKMMCLYWVLWSLVIRFLLKVLVFMFFW